jgi:hypothetical protein
MNGSAPLSVCCANVLVELTCLNKDVAGSGVFHFFFNIFINLFNKLHGDALVGEHVTLIGAIVFFI